MSLTCPPYTRRSDVSRQSLREAALIFAVALTFFPQSLALVVQKAQGTVTAASFAAADEAPRTRSVNKTRARRRKSIFGRRSLDEGVGASGKAPRSRSALEFKVCSACSRRSEATGARATEELVAKSLTPARPT